MNIKNVNDITPIIPKEVEGVKMRVAIGRDEGAPRFVLRHFELAAECATPRHAHWWEHEVYILKGKGEVLTPDGFKEIGPGDTVFVPGDEEHQFRNTGDDAMEFICVIPHIDE